MSRPLDAILGDLRRAAVIESQTYRQAKVADESKMDAQDLSRRWSSPVKGLDKTSRVVAAAVLEADAQEQRAAAVTLYGKWQQADSLLKTIQGKLVKNLAETETLTSEIPELTALHAAASEEKRLKTIVDKALIPKTNTAAALQAARGAQPQNQVLKAELEKQLRERTLEYETAVQSLEAARETLATKEKALIQKLLKDKRSVDEFIEAAKLSKITAERQPVTPPGSPVVAAAADAAAADAAPVVHAPVTKDPALLDKIWAEYTKFCKKDEGLTEEGGRIGADRIEASLQSRNSTQPLLAFDGVDQACRFFTNIAKSAPEQPFFSEEIGDDGKPTGEYIVYDGKGDTETATAVHGKLSQATIQRCIKNSAAIGTSGKTQELHDILMNKEGLSQIKLDEQINRFIDAAVPSATASASIEATQRHREAARGIVESAAALAATAAVLSPPRDGAIAGSQDLASRPDGPQ